jgi:hypothetical protein
MADVTLIDGGWIILIQAAMLVLYYGGIFPNLPWWVVWFPFLVVAAILGIVLLIILVLLILLLIGVIS